MQRIGMTDSRQWQPAVNETPHTIPQDAAVLASPRQRAMPEPPYLEPKDPQRRCVHGHPVVPDVSTHDSLQPSALFKDGYVHAPPKLGFHLVQLRLQPFAYRLPQHREHSVASLLRANVRKAEKVERLRLPFSSLLLVLDRKRTKFQKSRLLGMQLQMELPHSLGEFRPKLIGLRLCLKSQHDIIRETHDDHFAERPLPTPRLGPQVEHVMKIDVSQQRRSASALGRTLLHTYPFPFLQHASVEPFLDQSHDAPVCNPMLHELDKPFVGKPIEGTYDTLPIIRTFPRESRLSVLVIRSKVNHSLFLGPSIGTVDCISF